jgi:hypothetical protein
VADFGTATPTSATGAEVTDRPSQQRREQMLNLAAGQRDQPERRLLASVFGNGRHHQEGVGEQGQGGPAVAGAPAAHLVLGAHRAALTREGLEMP